ncbi:phosphoglucomutase/phosphomannomutase family protein [Candidatus Avelusimicrobium luingense]|uniref:phosphoglucomutase/phosphomannomutase family protein n=1 Tax=Candidatus Avelusimicrobium luingense TaxID=3416211 RepID=UPI003D0CFF73
MATDIRFGTDGWRGIIAWDFTFENVRRTAQALADYINENAPAEGQGKSPKIFVGFDRRFMSDIFAKEIAHIFRSNKLDVTLSDRPVTSPLAACLSLSKFWISIMVTASHNPAQYNGIKVKLAGGAASVRVTRDIEELIDKSSILAIYGQEAPQKDLTDVYLKYVTSRVNLKKIKTLKGKVVVDYMYGAAAGYVEKILGDKQVIALRAEHDTTFGGGQPEPVEKNLSELKKTVVAKKAVLGIAFDGDGDRVALVDEKGTYLTPCLIAAVLCDYFIKHKKLKGKIVQTVSMGYLLKRIARKYEMLFEEVCVGFKHVAELMALEDIAFGVEESGGFAWKNSLPDRDGLLVALAFLEVMTATGKKASELCAQIAQEYGASVYLRRDIVLNKPLVKEVFTDKIRRKVPKKIGTHKVAEMLTFDGLKILFDNDEWLLLRPSGTEPVLRIYAESTTKKDTQALLDFGEKLTAPFLK